MVVIGALQPLTYSPEAASLIPELLALAHDGQYAPLLAASLTVVGDLPYEFNPALFYSVTCSEDAPRVTRDERANGVAESRCSTSRSCEGCSTTWRYRSARLGHQRRLPVTASEASAG